jgi:hypothetical protein
MQVGGFVEREDDKGVKDGDGMKEELGGKTNCGTQLSLMHPQQLGRHDVIFDQKCVLGSDDVSSTWGRTRSISISHCNTHNNNQLYMQWEEVQQGDGTTEDGQWL